MTEKLKTMSSLQVGQKEKQNKKENIYSTSEMKYNMKPSFLDPDLSLNVQDFKFSPTFMKNTGNYTED